MGGEGKGGEGEGRGGEVMGGEGRGGRGGMTVIHILMAPQYLNSNHVTYYVIRKSTFDWVYAEQWYVSITFDVTWISGRTE